MQRRGGNVIISKGRSLKKQNAALFAEGFAQSHSQSNCDDLDGVKLVYVQVDPPLHVEHEHSVLA